MPHLRKSRVAGSDGKLHKHPTSGKLTKEAAAVACSFCAGIPQPTPRSWSVVTSSIVGGCGCIQAETHANYAEGSFEADAAFRIRQVTGTPCWWDALSIGSYSFAEYVAADCSGGAVRSYSNLPLRALLILNADLSATFDIFYSQIIASPPFAQRHTAFYGKIAAGLATCGGPMVFTQTDPRPNSGNLNQCEWDRNIGPTEINSRFGQGGTVTVTPGC